MDIDRRQFITAAAAVPALLPWARAHASIPQRHVHRGSDPCTPDVDYLPVSLKEVPLPRNIAFPVQHGGRTISLVGHYWYNGHALRRGARCPAIVELNP